jgi:hypothetical protein
MALGPYNVDRMILGRLGRSAAIGNVGGFGGERIAIGGGRSLNGARMAGPCSQLDRKVSIYGMLWNVVYL